MSWYYVRDRKRRALWFLFQTSFLIGIRKLGSCLVLVRNLSSFDGFHPPESTPNPFSNSRTFNVPLNLKTGKETGIQLHPILIVFEARIPSAYLTLDPRFSFSPLSFPIPVVKTPPPRLEKLVVIF